jgi:hypothetical protein
MDNVIDLIATDSKPSDVSDAIKAILYAKSAEKIDSARPLVASSLFGIESESESDADAEGTIEVDQDSQQEEEE